jgi:DNA-binding NarL/FixJ family response regulator
MPKSNRPSLLNQLEPVTTSIRVLVSERQALVRAGLLALLERIPEVAEATGTDSEQTLVTIKAFRPHIVLLELPFAGPAAFASLKEIAAKFPAVSSIVVTQHANEELAVQALRLGAAGVITKNSAGNELELAIRTVAGGEHYLAPEFSRHAILRYLNDPHTSASRLTERQQEVLQLIAEGRGTKEIAHSLKISVKTVETHRAQLMERLNIHDIAGLVRYALHTGLSKLE